jgi:hypothetical protein
MESINLRNPNKQCNTGRMIAMLGRDILEVERCNVGCVVQIPLQIPPLPHSTSSTFSISSTTSAFFIWSNHLDIINFINSPESFFHPPETAARPFIVRLRSPTTSRKFLDAMATARKTIHRAPSRSDTHSNAPGQEPQAADYMKKNTVVDLRNTSKSQWKPYLISYF